jgi:ubiquinone/menaquinone biosynthesis C-methylase UbiE
MTLRNSIVRLPLNQIFEEKYKGIRAITTPGVHAAAFALFQSAGHHPGDRVLDLACGAGAMTARLKDAGYRVTATDLDGNKFQPGGPKSRFFHCL